VALAAFPALERRAFSPAAGRAGGRLMVISLLNRRGVRR
jgi:hypothetical protein